jgi:hypothetical protein
MRREKREKNANKKRLIDRSLAWSAKNKELFSNPGWLAKF